MGRLEKRIKEIQLRGAGDPVRLVQEDRRRLELQWRRHRKVESQAEAIARKAQVTAKAALNASLKDLLKMVGVRELLGDMKKVWGGRVDWFPYEIPNAAEMLIQFDPLQFPALPALPAMGLGLRYRFRDSEPAEVRAYSSENPREGSCWSQRELFVSAIVGYTADELPYVASFYGSKIPPNSTSESYYGWGSKKRDGQLKKNPNHCVSYSGPDIIVPEASDHSQAILLGQLFGINEKASPFRVLEAQAVERLLNDYDLPGRARYDVSPFWHKRLAAHVPIVNLFLD